MFEQVQKNPSLREKRIFEATDALCEQGIDRDKAESLIAYAAKVEDRFQNFIANELATIDNDWQGVAEKLFFKSALVGGMASFCDAKRTQCDVAMAVSIAILSQGE